jgi:hypothetical protein
MYSYLSAKKVTLTSALAVVLLLCFGGVSLLAQVTSGAIFGAVKDQSGAYVAKAKVTVTSPAIGVTRTLTTGENGDFVAPNLLPGTYTIAVEAAGFNRVEKTNVILSAADRLDAGEFVLHVGAATQEVTVTADAGQLQLQSNSGERSDLITGKQLNDVALNGRMVLDYMRLIPGVVSDFDGSASTTYGIGAFNVNGTRANTHEYTVDGSSNVDTGDNATTHVTVNPDAIAEMKVLTSNYQAEFGKAGGGQVAVVTKSGTNQFHGNVRFFHRNEGMNANNWFADKANATTPGSVPIALYRYNYFGYQVGGPIKKNKLFFFWGQEYYRQLIPTGGLHPHRAGTDGRFFPNSVHHLQPGHGSAFPGEQNRPQHAQSCTAQHF